MCIRDRCRAVFAIFVDLVVHGLDIDDLAGDVAVSYTHLNDYQGAIEYIQNMDDNLKASSIQKFTDNMVANILLAEKKQRAEAEDMEFEFYSDGVSLAFVDGADACAILGNLLDNALEGSRKSVDKTIQIDIYEDPAGEIKLTAVSYTHLASSCLLLKLWSNTFWQLAPLLRLMLPALDR